MNEQQAFEEALRIQAVGAGTPTLTLDDVRGRARGIRRRRASVAAAGSTHASAVLEYHATGMEKKSSSSSSDGHHASV